MYVCMYIYIYVYVFIYRDVERDIIFKQNEKKRTQFSEPGA